MIFVGEVSAYIDDGLVTISPVRGCWRHETPKVALQHICLNCATFFRDFFHRAMLPCSRLCRMSGGHFHLRNDRGSSRQSYTWLYRFEAFIADVAACLASIPASR